MEKNHCSIVPYRDPADDTPNTDQILTFDDERSCLGLPEYPEIAETSSRNALSFPQSIGNGDTINVLDPNDILLDPYILEVINESNGGNGAEIPVAGSSGFNGERIGPANLDSCGIGQSSGFGNPIQQRIGQANVDNCGSGQSTEFGNPVQLSVWPVPPSPYNCSCCNILREIIHTNGIHVTNLEIHGRLGIISHAVLDRYDLDLFTQNHEYQMFDFCKESIDSVKNFLVQYCQDRKREGYNMLQDPLSIFYEALCVGLHEKENHNMASGAFYPSSMSSGSQQIVASSGDAENNGVRLDRSNQQEIPSQHKVERSGARAKSRLATQRERTSKMKLKDFSGCFHLPINDAAKRMKVCPTVVKKICRQGGLSRWPHRKIKGIKRKISIKQQSLNAATAEERARALADIQMLEQQLADIFAELVSCQ